MTHSDPSPGVGPPDDIDSELGSIFDAETAKDIQFAELDVEARVREDAMLTRLLENNFPLLPEILEVRTQLGVESGLAEVYGHLVDTMSNLRDRVASTPEAKEALAHNYQLAFLQSRLTIAVQLLAGAKGAQDSILDQVKICEDAGDYEMAEIWRKFAHEARKEAEAQALADDSLGEKTATRILQVLAPEFEGESLLPMTEESRGYLMMHRLKNEKSSDDRDAVKMYTVAAQTLLASKLTDEQRQHPDFENFSFSLCVAVARTVLEPKHTTGFTKIQLGTYRSMISYHVAEAMKYAPQMGIGSVEVRTIFEDILSQLL